MESIRFTIESFYEIVGEVSPIRLPRKERKPMARRRAAIGLGDFEKEIKEKFGTQEFRSREATQHYIDKGMARSPAMKRKIWYNLRRLYKLGRLSKLKKGIWQFAE